MKSVKGPREELGRALLLLSILKYRQFCFRVDKTVGRVREYLPVEIMNL